MLLQTSVHANVFIFRLESEECDKEVKRENEEGWNWKRP